MTRSYYEQVVRPLLDDPLVEFLGQLDEQAKRELMRDALALLMPITWPEPFGMVYIEALACGTPVLTCPYGAAPEILRDGVTGFLRSERRGSGGGGAPGGGISREECRAYVRRRFDIRTMARATCEPYAQVIEEAHRDEAVHASADGAAA